MSNLSVNIHYVLLSSQAFPREFAASFIQAVVWKYLKYGTKCIYCSFIRVMYPSSVQKHGERWQRETKHNCICSNNLIFEVCCMSEEKNKTWKKQYCWQLVDNYCSIIFTPYFPSFPLCASIWPWGLHAEVLFFLLLPTTIICNAFISPSHIIFTPSHILVTAVFISSAALWIFCWGLGCVAETSPIQQLGD